MNNKVMLEEFIKILNKKTSKLSFKYLNYKMLKFLTRFTKNKYIKTKARTFFSTKMHVIIPEAVSNHVYLKGYYDQRVVYMMLANLKEGSTFVDVGAHFGFNSLLAQKIVGPMGRVISIEPTPSTYSILKKNSKQFNNITTYNNAAFSKNQLITIKDLGLKFSAYNSVNDPWIKDASIHVNEIQVRAVKLDEFFAENNIRPDFIKIDAENCEEFIITGLDNTLKTIKPILIVELADVVDVKFGVYSERVVKMIESYGYSSFEFRDQQIVPLDISKSDGDCNALFIPN